MWKAARAKVLEFQEGRKAKKHSQLIDLQIRNGYEHHKWDPKVVLFGKFDNRFSIDLPDQIHIGTPDSGTSTLQQQIKIIYNGGFSEEEAKSYRKPIYVELLQSLIAILQRMKTDQWLELKHLTFSFRKCLNQHFRDARLMSCAN